MSEEVVEVTQTAPAEPKAPVAVEQDKIVDAIKQTEFEAPVKKDVPPPPGWVTGEGAWDEDVRLSLPDDLGKHSIFDKYKSVADLAKGAINKDKFIGQKVEEWITSDDPDIVKIRNEKMGVPNKPEEYVYNIPEGFDDLPEEIRNRTLNYIEQQRGFAKDLGITKTQFQKFINKDLIDSINMYKQNASESEKRSKDAEMELRRVWRGNSFDENSEKVENFLDAIGLDFMKPFIKDNPEAILKAYEASKKIADDDIIDANQKQDMATIGETFDDITDKMLSYRGRQSDPEYQHLLKQRNAILNKMK